MSLYAIGDFHLGFGVNKTMDQFGKNWENHVEKIAENWKKHIKACDTVLLLGDISWAMTLQQLLPDMNFIQSLPGKKICIPGNHDYWWSSISKVQKLYTDIVFLRNNSTTFNDFFLCGTKGWICPNDTFFTPEYQKIYFREVNRFKLSLEDAMKKGAEQIIVLLHFPPTNDKKENSAFLELIKHYPVKYVFYAHLHGEQYFKNSLLGQQNGVFYDLLSCDSIHFCPKKVIE